MQWRLSFTTDGALAAGFADPAALSEARRLYGERDDQRLVSSKDEALIGADAGFIPRKVIARRGWRS